MLRIGPDVNREWWRGPYGKITADRGPCTFHVSSSSIQFTADPSRWVWLDARPRT
jgi:hypothetical protein